MPASSCSRVAVTPQEASLAALHGLDIVVHDPVHFEILDHVAGQDVLRVWLKLDTGMGRLGFAPAELGACRKRLDRIAAVHPAVSLMTHLACADDADNPTTLEQVRRFGSVLEGFPGDISIANSAAILIWPQTLEPSMELRYTADNWVRPGLALYRCFAGAGAQRPRTGVAAGHEFRVPPDCRQDVAQGCDRRLRE